MSLFETFVLIRTTFLLPLKYLQYSKMQTIYAPIIIDKNSNSSILYKILLFWQYASVYLQKMPLADRKSIIF